MKMKLTADVMPEFFHLFSSWGDPQNPKDEIKLKTRPQLEDVLNRTKRILRFRQSELDEKTISNLQQMEHVLSRHPISGRWDEITTSTCVVIYIFFSQRHQPQSTAKTY